MHDRVARTLTAALSLRGGSFALLGADEQDRRVDAWASVLASLAREGSPVRRVQWVAASFPDDGRGVRAYLADEAVPGVASACTASYDALLADMDSRTCAHDVVLALQVRLTKSVEVGCAALAREVASLARLLADADLQVESVLSADDLARQLLRTYEPHLSADVEASHLADPWPMAMEESWSAVRVDGMVHATFWVAEWPRVEVRSDFLAPLLLGPARATLAVVMEPLGPDQAVRKVEASRTADLADAELRRRGGFVSTAPSRPGVGGPGPPRGGAGRGPRVVPLRGLRHRLGARGRGAGGGLRRGAARRRPEPAGPATPLRGPGGGLHLHAAAVPRLALTGGAGSRCSRSHGRGRGRGPTAAPLP